MFLKEDAENKETLDCARPVCDARAQEMEAGGQKSMVKSLASLRPAWAMSETLP